MAMAAAATPSLVRTCTRILITGVDPLPPKRMLKFAEREVSDAGYRL
jgi:hypothetical protein